MALPPGITPKTVTVGIASFFDGSLADGTATITAPVNVVHTPSNRPIFSSQMSHRFVDGETSFNLCPTDAPGLNRVDFAYKLSVVISGALVQPEPIYFTLPTAGPDEIDLDALVTVPSSAGTPISVDALTTSDLPPLVTAEGPFSDALRGASVALVTGSHAPPSGAQRIVSDTDVYLQTGGTGSAGQVARTDPARSLLIVVNASANNLLIAEADTDAAPGSGHVTVPPGSEWVSSSTRTVYGYFATTAGYARVYSEVSA